MDDRELDLTEEQKEVKAKYPPINKKYEYLDHTADVQIHSWGDSLEEAFEQCAMGMFGYMTDTETVEPIDTLEVESEGDDMESLLFHFLDDWLFKFSADLFFIPRVSDPPPLQLLGPGHSDLPGTEVKAITYSAMQIYDKEKPEIFAIVDI
uniref:Protein archease n=1 Tax=Myripristis murdjan TaxID=586833 RepID=A0A668AHE8_9TELE